MVLTAAGRELIPHVDEIFRAVDRLYYLKQDLFDCEGELHIGVAETCFCYRLPCKLRL